MLSGRIILGSLVRGNFWGEDAISEKVQLLSSANEKLAHICRAQISFWLISFNKGHRYYLKLLTRSSVREKSNGAS